MIFRLKLSNNASGNRRPVKIIIMVTDMPDDVREYLAEQCRKNAKKGAAARWAGHTKLTDEQKKEKRKLQQRAYRAKRKKDFESN